MRPCLVGVRLPEFALSRHGLLSGRGNSCRARPDVTDVPMLPQHERIVLVVLQDGRQLEGELIVLTDRFEVDGVMFESWEIEELEDVT